MSEFLPKSVRDGLQSAKAAPRRRSNHRMTIHVGENVYPILRVFDRGFEVETDETPQLRGLVDIFDGPRHMTRALIVATGETDGVMRYEYKRSTRVSDRAPLDFVEQDGISRDLLPSDG